MVLSPNAESSQRIFFSSNYKHLANEIKDGGPIHRTRISHSSSLAKFLMTSAMPTHQKFPNHDIN